MHPLQQNNEASDMLTAQDYTPLNEYEKTIVQNVIGTPNPRESIARNGLCPYHPEIVRALSLSHSGLLRLLERGTQISLTTSPRSSFEIIG